MGRIDVVTVIGFAELACSGMWSDVERVEPAEDPDVAAREIVDYWEGEGCLLSGRDGERWEELQPSREDAEELYERCVERIAQAIRDARARKAA